MSLVLAGRDTQQGLKYPINHYAERTFLTHCRALYEFFDPKNKDKDDLHANDFTKSKFKVRFPTWAKWREHLNHHLLHLTVDRLNNTRPWDGRDNKKILKDFESAWDKFMDELKPGLKPLFEAEIRKRGGL